MNSFEAAGVIFTAIFFIGAVILFSILEPMIGVSIGLFLFIWLCTHLWMKYIDHET